MKNILLIVIITMSYFLFSCNKKSDCEHFSKFEDKVNVKFDSVGITENYKSGILYYLDTFLVLTNTLDNKNQIHIYDTCFTYVCSAGHIGNGPGEISNPFQGTVDRENRIIWFLDMARKKILKFPLDSILMNPSYLPKEMVPIPDFKIIIAYQPFSDSLFSFCKIPKEDDVLSFFNLKGHIVDSMTIKDRLKPHDMYSDIPEKSYQQNYMYACHPNKKLIAIIERFSDILTIIDFNGKVLRQVQGPDRINQVPDPFSNEQIVTNWSFKCNENYIFCLYLGKKRYYKNKNLKDETNYPNILHIYDWNGNPKSEIVLDKPIITFAIDDNSRKLVALSAETGDFLYCNLMNEKN